MDGERLTREIDTQEHDGQALGADLVGEDLGGVADEHARPGEVVEEVVNVDHSDDSFARGCGLGHGVACGADSPDNEGDEHAGC